VISLRAGPTERSWFDSPEGQEIFFSKESIAALWPTQPFVQLVSGDLFREVKRPAREACDPPPFSAEVMNEWNYTSTPHSFHRDNFTFVYTAVKTNFLEKLKLCSHSGGSKGFLRNYRKAARGKMKWRRTASSVRQERHLELLLS
jgi:hypothetical protein